MTVHTFYFLICIIFIYSELDSQIHSQYPHQYVTPGRPKPPPAETGDSHPTFSSTEGYNDSRINVQEIYVTRNVRVGPQRDLLRL